MEIQGSLNEQTVDRGETNILNPCTIGLDEMLYFASSAPDSFLMCFLHMPKSSAKTGKCRLADIPTSSAISGIDNDVFEHITALNALIFHQFMNWIARWNIGHLLSFLTIFKKLVPFRHI